MKLKGAYVIRLVFRVSAVLYSFKIIRLKIYSMAINGNCSTKPSNIALLLEKKQMLTRLESFQVNSLDLKDLA